MYTYAHEIVVVVAAVVWLRQVYGRAVILDKSGHGHVESAFGTAVAFLGLLLLVSFELFLAFA